MNRLNLPIVIVVLLIFVIIIGTVFVWPRYQKLKILGNMAEERRVELRNQEDYMKNLTGMAEELKKYETSLPKIDSALPDTTSLPALLDFLQKASSQSGLILKGMGSISVTPNKTIPNVKETKLSLVVDGSYSSFKDFLQIIEKTARLIEVENISFSASREGGPLTFNLRIKTNSY